MSNVPGLGMTKDQFTAAMKKAMADPASKEKTDLYFTLLKCFTDADVNRDGSVDPIEFDQMIEAAAAHPRFHGLAPQTIEMYKTPEARLDGRKKMFGKMDGNNDGQISLDEWLGFCFDHIAEKVKSVK